MKKKQSEELDNVHPLVMTEEFWANSQFSLAGHYGRVRLKGHEYWIVNKEGIDIFALSVKASKERRAKAIEPGEPRDLCLRELIPVYHWLGRDEMLKRIKDGAKPSELLADYKESKKRKKKEDEK